MGSNRANCLTRSRGLYARRTNSNFDDPCLRSTRAINSMLEHRQLPAQLGIEGDADATFHALQADANQEFANLLRDVQTVSNGAPLGKSNGKPISELLLQAVRCAAKQYMLQAELGSLALRDDLTDLYNRRGFMAIAERQLKLARRCGKGMLLLFVDVDNLKRINDTYGHGEGDRALRRVSDALGHTFRDSDLIARIGGDEFVVLATEGSGQAGTTIRDRLRKYLQPKGDSDSCTISLSLGDARYDPRKDEPLRVLLAQADSNMYAEKRAKAAGAGSVLIRRSG